MRAVIVTLKKKVRTSGKGHWDCVVDGEPKIDTSKFGPVVDYIDADGTD